MDAAAIRRLRLHNQGIFPPSGSSVADVVGRLGALQGQDYGGALWSLGLRLPRATSGDVERAVSERAIVRGWFMRGTLHMVSAASVRPMLDLFGPRLVAGTLKRRQALELDDGTLATCARLIERALASGEPMTRSDLLAAVEAGGIPAGPQRGYHILFWSGINGLICFGPAAGKQQTFVGLDAWLPRPPTAPSRAEALATLAQAYFTSHGPATLDDFTNWTGLPASETRAALAAVSGGLESFTVGRKVWWTAPGIGLPQSTGSVQLLPGFDEFLLGYRDRSAVLAPEHARRIVPGSNGIFLPTVVIDGRVMGLWKRVARARSSAITVEPFEPLPEGVTGPLEAAAERYGAFLGHPVTVTTSAS